MSHDSSSGSTVFRGTLAPAVVWHQMLFYHSSAKEFIFKMCSMLPDDHNHM